jgi:type II secretory pathway pseudopilin PulG
MVVILIIGLLATVVIINELPATDKAARTKAKADVSTLESAAKCTGSTSFPIRTRPRGSRRWRARAM